MKILIFGVGYVGLALLSQLKEGGHEVYVTTTSQEKVAELEHLANHVVWLKDDKREGLKEVVTLCDAIVVLVAPNKGIDYEKTYLETAKSIVSLLEGRKTPYYLLYTSSTSVYRGLKGEWATEDLLCSPPEDNGNILLQTEKVYLGLSSSCILRLGGIFGPGRDLFKRAKYFSGQEMGDGDSVTNHIHRDDIVSAIQFCLDRGLKGIYNLVNDDHPTRKKLYTELCAERGWPLPIWKEDPLTTPYRGIKVSNQKIKELGFSCRHRLIGDRIQGSQLKE